MRSAMFSGKRRLVTGLVAASLMATMVAETGQSPAAAKPAVKAGPTLPARTVTTAAATVLFPYGPTGCVDGSPIKILDGKTVSKTQLELGTACTKYDASTTSGDIEAIKSLLADSTDVSATPIALAAPIELLTNSPEITYSLGTSTSGINPTITANGQLTIAPLIGSLDGSVTIIATQTYAENTRANYTYNAQVQFIVPVFVRPESRPTCQVFTVSTLMNLPKEISLPYEAARSGGCQGGYGQLKYNLFVESPENGTPALITPDSSIATFTPNLNFQTSADNTLKAIFYLSATDEYGQVAKPLDQQGNQAKRKDSLGIVIGDYLAAPITVNVSEPSDCGGWVPKTETIFNNPLAGTSRDGKLSNSRFAITNRINNMIDCAKPGSTIAMSWFSFTDDNMVNHLIQAKNRGVNVRVLVNSHATKPSSSSFTAVNTLRVALGSEITNANANASDNYGSWLASCDSGCLTPPAPAGIVFPDESEGEYPALHSKFFLISQAGRASNIVGISSVNPTYEQAKVGFNNASVVVNDTTLFASMNQYYADLANAARGGAKANAYRQLKSNSKTTTYYVYPKTGSDDVLTMLRDIKCVYKVGKKTMRTQIYVNMFVFTRNAPAMELWKKAFASRANNGGCNVQVIYTDMDQRIKALNTRTGKYDFIPNGDKPSAWGAADCLSTFPTKKGKAQKLTGPGLVFDAGKNRMVTAKVCKNGSLQGAIPTINKGGGYCWFNAKNKSTGGSLSMCVSTPLKITAFDKADNRAKLENIADSSGRRWYSHQKYIAIDGMYGKPGKQTRQQVVISGTPNITSPGQRWNDEILTFTTSPEIYAQYVTNFTEMKKAIQSRPGPSGEGRAEARW